jgi:hypothetical protein
MSDIFECCQTINNYLLTNNEQQARNELIKLLDSVNIDESEYGQLINYLIRETGLYPYLSAINCAWDDRFLFEAFKIDVGYNNPVTLHREQSFILKQLLNGENIIVSAPTSFGKSFIIDAFISINRPNNVVIIVPTLALTDETRRRIYRKFSNEYKIITTSDAELAEKNILVFPQERALSYIDILKDIDILIIDEFYKISTDFGDERSPSLYKAISKLSNIAKQKYFLAPNIKSLHDEFITKNMKFINKLDFNTVIIQKNDSYKQINNEQEKGIQLINILTLRNKENEFKKTLIYAGTYNEIEKVAFLLLEKISPLKTPLLEDFSAWLKKNYFSGWNLPSLIERGVGIHNGQLHRSLAQIQIKLFEETNGLQAIISTSSIIEGVNTSAENVVIWRNRNGRHPLNDFTYKNIIGRGGRMFKYFIGKIYLLEKPPEESDIQLTIKFPEELLGNYDETDIPIELSTEQKNKNDNIRKEIINIIGKENYDDIFKGNKLQTIDTGIAFNILKSLRDDGDIWNGFSYLNSDNPEAWNRLLYQIINLGSDWQSKYSDIVEFTKVLSKNWEKPIPELLEELDDSISIGQFFKLERIASYKLSSLLNDVNILYKAYKKNDIDISPFIYKVSNAFLPRVVYQLEEYGLPRMISRILSKQNIIKLDGEEQDIYKILIEFENIGIQKILSQINFSPIEKYILKYFFEGISFNKANPLKDKSP